MKRYYLMNLLLTLFAGVMFMFFRYESFFISLIMRQDIIYFVVVLPVYLAVGIFAVAYQVFAFKKSKLHWMIKVLSLLTSIYLILLLCLQSRIYNTTGTGTMILLMAAPLATTTACGVLANIKFKRA